MPYFYNETPGEIASYGQNLGQSLGQAFVGLPIERAKLVQGLLQMQQANQLRNLQLQGLQQYHQGLLQNAQQRDKDRASYQQSLDQYRQLMGQVALLRAQQAAANPRNSFLSLGGGNAIGPVAPQPQGQPGAPQQGVGQQPGGGFQLYSTPGKNQNFTPNEMLNDLYKQQALFAGLAGSTNPILQHLGGDVSNQVYALRPLVMQALTNRGGLQQQLGTNQVPNINTNDPLGLGL